MRQQRCGIPFQGRERGGKGTDILHNPHTRNSIFQGGHLIADGFGHSLDIVHSVRNHRPARFQGFKNLPERGGALLLQNGGRVLCDSRGGIITYRRHINGELNHALFSGVITTFKTVYQHI